MCHLLSIIKVILKITELLEIFRTFTKTHYSLPSYLKTIYKIEDNALIIKENYYGNL